MQTFWSQFNSHFKSLSKNVEWIDIVLGTDSIKENIVIQNAKHHIYISLINNKNPCLKAYISHLTQIANIEKNIYMRKNNMCEWLERWEKVLPV